MDSRLSQNLFNHFVIFHLEIPGAVVEVREHLHPPKVVKGDDKGKVDYCLFIEFESKIEREIYIFSSQADKYTYFSSLEFT